MLIHKATMGVLNWVWTGTCCRGPGGALEPVYRRAALADVDDPENWWEIPNTGALYRRVRDNYPFLEPQTGPDGELLGVDVPGDPERQARAEAAQEALREEARARGYQSAGRARRPKGLFGSLESPKRTTQAADVPSMKKLLKELTR